MSKGVEINIVWLKRDLRLQDHAPLESAEKWGLPYLIVFNWDPQLLKAPEVSSRHLQFQYHSILEINNQLKEYRREVLQVYGSMGTFIQQVSKTLTIANIFSHQEIGTQQTWNRDRQVAAICQSLNINWTQFPFNGVERGRQDRKGWDRAWFDTMKKPVIENQFSLNSFKYHVPQEFVVPHDMVQRLKNYSPDFQKPGSLSAWQVLQSFMNTRGFDYQKLISKPTESRNSCSRLSPYLAWGNLSVKQIYQFVKKHDHYQNNKRPYNAFLQRLKWRCHFMQKFEMECEYEFRCVNRGYELLEYEHNPQFIEAWKKGMTGVPLVDACMRCVKQTGWINFRMRAMLVSFLCHHLGQNWKEGAHYLAQQFLDYEPGIHFPQFQMQAGVTGINTLRIYNPIKQAMDHDPNAKFIKKWVQELKGLPDSLALRPWLITPMEAQLYAYQRSYPKPIVDLSVSANKMRTKMWSHRSHSLVIQEKERILNKHTRKT